MLSVLTLGSSTSAQQLKCLKRQTKVLFYIIILSTIYKIKIKSRHKKLINYKLIIKYLNIFKVETKK